MGDIPPASSFGSPLGRLIVDGRLRPPAQPGGRPTLDRFEILEWLGEGGMGEVLLARDAAHGSDRVAIKLLKTELAKNPYAVRRFLKEARLMERLAHPAIVPVLEVFDGQEGPAFAMPLFKAGSAASLLREGNPLEPAQILAIARPVAEALRHAHGKGVIHRDLKPANLLLLEDGSAALGDFGLARTTFNDSMLDLEQGHRSGTAAYLAPEVTQGEAGDTRVDIYSFGAVLYELLTGRPPYDGASTPEILQKIKTAAPSGIRELQPKAPVPLVAIAEGAMARNVRDRYASMADVAADLERAQRGLALRGPHGRTERNFSRHLKPVAAVLAAGSVVVAAWFLWPERKSKEARDFTVPSLSDNATNPAIFELNEVRSFTLPLFRLGIEPRVGPWDSPDRPAIFFSAKDELLIYSTSGELLPSYTLEAAGVRALELNMLADVWAPVGQSSDGRVEAILSWTQQITNLHMLVVNQHRKPWKHFQAVGGLPTEKGGWMDSSAMCAHVITDLNRDGRRELLAVVNTGWSKQPRGLVCFDFESQTQLWQRLIAPAPMEPAIIDLDHDGTSEVVLGSGAVSNGCRLPDGTDDAHSYIFAFSHTGTPLWTTNLGDVHTRVHPLAADLDGDRREELLAWLEGKAAFRSNQVGRIMWLADDGKAQASYDAGVSLLSCMRADLNGDGKSEILATDLRGVVHVLGNHLERLEIAKLVPPREDLSGDLRRYNYVDLRLVAVTNLDHTADPEIVLTSQQVEHVSGMNPGLANREPNVLRAHDVAVHVLDARLKVLATHRVAAFWEGTIGLSVAVADIDADRIPELMVFAKQRVTVLKLRRTGE